jgi:SAM-dependent methyltransferase
MAILRKLCSPTPQTLVADIGCGTGISTRALAEWGWRIVGIEPNAEMRQTAESISNPGDGVQIEYRAGNAEDTGLPGESIDMVVCAQSFHWFKPESALIEFSRILKPQGWVVLLWNIADSTDEFTARFWSLLTKSSSDKEVARESYDVSGSELMGSALYQNHQQSALPNAQVVSQDGLLGRAFSASFAPRDPDSASELKNQLQALFQQYSNGDTVMIRYVTMIYVAQKNSSGVVLS